MKYILLLCWFIISWPAATLAGVQLHGHFTQGGLISGHTLPGNQVLLDEQPVSTSQNGDFIIGFGRDARPQYKLKVIDQSGTVSEQEIKIADRNYRIERINGISKQMMHPSDQQLQRIHEEADLVRDTRSQLSPLQNFSESFRWPLHGRISGSYGSQRIFNGEPRRPHFGIDIAAVSGTPVTAPAGGRVTLAHEGMFYSGKTLIIDHGLGLSSTFLHLSKITVKAGELVSQGDIIAEVGASGRATGPHLDWRVNWFQTRLDPELLVPAMPAAK